MSTLADTINAVKDSFFTIINDPEILEEFIESMGLEEMINSACPPPEEGVRVELVKENDE